MLNNVDLQEPVIVNKRLNCISSFLPSSCVITYLLSIYLPLRLLSSHTVRLNKSHLPHPTSSPVFAFQLHLPPASFPTLPSSSRFYLGEEPGVIHLSLLTWPLTGLLGQQACLVRIMVVEGRGESSNSVFCHGDIPENSKNLRDLVCNREHTVGKYKQAWVDYNIATCKENCGEITQRNVFNFYLHLSQQETFYKLIFFKYLRQQ